MTSVCHHIRHQFVIIYDSSLPSTAAQLAHIGIYNFPSLLHIQTIVPENVKKFYAKSVNKIPSKPIKKLGPCINPPAKRHFKWRFVGGMIVSKEGLLDNGFL